MTKGFEIKLARSGDIDELVRQRRMMFADMKHGNDQERVIGDRAYRKWALEKMKKGLLRCYLVTDEKGEIAAGGAAWLREEQPGPGHGARLVPYLMSMYTEPKFRRKGLASLIVQEAVGWAQKNGYPGMTLHASKEGRKVYPRLGWKRGWEMYLDFE
ncbi:MAG: GNAT family N-acetyltransferase [Thaumarchaeota archaeon]|nr:GNAT family N-acetyltransferase [Nitrososphaerota archaeon]